MSDEREILTWEKFGVASRELAIQIAESGYEPDIILAIARGGLLTAGALGYALSVKNTYTMNVEFYTGVNERLAVPMILPPVPSLVDIKDSKVLIVDDVDISPVRPGIDQGQGWNAHRRRLAPGRRGGGDPGTADQAAPQECRITGAYIDIKIAGGIIALGSNADDGAGSRRAGKPSSRQRCSM